MNQKRDRNADSWLTRGIAVLLSGTLLVAAAACEEKPEASGISGQGGNAQTTEPGAGTNAGEQGGGKQNEGGQADPGEAESSAAETTGAGPDGAGPDGTNSDGGNTPSAIVSPAGTAPSANPANPGTSAGADPAQCLVGTWIADNAHFLARLKEFGDEVRSVQGQVVVNFGADGTLIHEYQNWQITASVEGNDVVLNRTGVDTGTFQATAEAVSMEETAVTSTLTMTAEGFTMQVPSAPISYTVVTYNCDARQAVIYTPDGDMVLNR